MTLPTTLHALHIDQLSAYTRNRLHHLADGEDLHIPGSPSAGFHPRHPLTIYRHPYITTQMPLIAGTFTTLTADPGTWLISLAHLAHTECPTCQATWTEAADCLDALPAHTQLFHTQQLGEHYLLLHREDQP